MQRADRHTVSHAAGGDMTVRSAREALVLTILTAGAPALAQSPTPFEYRVLATSKTSTLQQELNDMARAGYRFHSVMGGETAIGGKEVVAMVVRVPGASERFSYRLLATSRTSTMQKELQAAAEVGFEYRGQTVFETLMGGKEVVCILERDGERKGSTSSYRLLATSRTSTLEREINDAGAQGFELLGMTVGKTAMGGAELVAITRKR
jgi:hypothetical protein